MLCHAFPPLFFMKICSLSPELIHPPPDRTRIDMLRPLSKAGKRIWRLEKRVTERRR
jgi:hypothetical protein